MSSNGGFPGGTPGPSAHARLRARRRDQSCNAGIAGADGGAHRPRRGHGRRGALPAPARTGDER
eukprot:8388630-Lingulodinium_polyedra.AAC.1